VSNQVLFHILFLDKPSVESERVLQLLKDSNYKVTQTADPIEAQQICVASPPDLIVVNVEERERENKAFLRQAKTHYATHSVPIIVTTEEGDHRKRIEYMEMGADDLLLKPYYPEDLAVRIANIFQECKSPFLMSKTTDHGFVGSLVEMDLIDLIQTMELGGKSGIIHLSRGDKDGQVYIHEGKIVDAVVQGYNSVKRAFLHMLTWIDGSFYVVFQDVPMNAPLTDNNQKLFEEASKIIEQWRQVTSDLPSMHTHLVAVSDKSAHALGQQKSQMLKIFREAHTILQAIDYSDFDDIDGLKIIKSLLEMGLLIEKEIVPGEGKAKSYKAPLSGLNGTRKFKNKYSHIFSIFQRNKGDDNLSSSRVLAFTPAVDNKQILTSGKKIQNRIRLTKAELLLIRQKLGS